MELRPCLGRSIVRAGSMACDGGRRWVNIPIRRRVPSTRRSARQSNRSAKRRTNRAWSPRASLRKPRELPKSLKARPRAWPRSFDRWRVGPSAEGQPPFRHIETRKADQRHILSRSYCRRAQRFHARGWPIGRPDRSQLRLWILAELLAEVRYLISDRQIEARRRSNLRRKCLKRLERVKGIEPSS